MDNAYNVRSTPSDEVLHFKKYFYRPVLGAAIAFIILFGVPTIAHLYQMIRTKTWFMVPFVIGAACRS